MALTSQVSVGINATQTSLLDLAIATVPLSVLRGSSTSDGTGLGQADRIFHDTRTLTASSSEDLDLAGVLLDVFGAAITFARIKTMLISAAPGNTNNVIVGNAATNGFISWVGGALHTVTVRPGGLLLVSATDATAYTVTAATADLLHITNSAGSTSVTYDVVLIGASA